MQARIESSCPSREILIQFNFESMLVRPEEDPVSSSRI
jgi:hypothetical protein